MFEKQQADFKGELHEVLGTVRTAGRQEGILIERQRILGELALKLIGAPNSEAGHERNLVLVELRERIENPREPGAVGSELLEFAREALKAREVRGESI
jgi:hypothetical protein